MIISASYKTDIPAFYGQWFVNRLDTGFCQMVNPYGGQVYRVGLTRDEVDGFVFWTKNLGPFLDRLALVHQRGYPFMVQYSLNGYPRALEFSVVNADRSIEHMQTLSQRYGPRVAVWRYDPIVFTSLTPPHFHQRTFARLARALAGTTDEVVISFAQMYRKTRRNMAWAAGALGFTWDDPSDELKRSLAADLTQIAKLHGMQLTVCAQRQFLVPGAQLASCIDAQRLSDIAGHPIGVPVKGNRPDCACFQSRDIGEYDTCPHCCVYCYAVGNRGLAQERHREHDPQDEFLYRPRVAPTPE